MPAEYSVPAEGVIPYKYLAVPTNFTEDKYVQFAEIRQGNRRTVHHVLLAVRYPGQGKLPDPGEIPPNEVFSARAGGGDGGARPERPADSDGRLVGWAPGEAPLALRAGQAKLIKKGSMLVFQIHYVTTGEPGKDRTSLGLVFSKDPIE